MSNDDDTAVTMCTSTASTPNQDVPLRHHRNRSQWPELFEHIKRSDWRKLRNALESSQCYFLCQERDETQLNCLTMAMVSQTPLDLVEKMIEIDPRLPFRQDIYGATSLHLACLNGTSIEKIETILAKSHEGEIQSDRQRITAQNQPSSSAGISPAMLRPGEALASMLDYDRRSALHHAIEFVCTSTFNKKKIRPNFFRIGGRHEIQKNTQIHLEYCLKLVNVICEASPSMVFSKCKNGLIPADILQIHKVKIFKKNKNEDSDQYLFLDKVYMILKKTSILEYKRQKILWEMDGGSSSSVRNRRSRNRRRSSNQ